MPNNLSKSVTDIFKNLRYIFIIILYLFLFAAGNLSAQFAKIGNVDTPHIKDRNGIEGNYGFTKWGQYLNVGISRNITTNVYAGLTGGLEMGKFDKKNLKYNSFTIDLEAHYIFLRWRNALFLSAAGGLTCNFDRLKEIESKNNQYTNYGVFAGLESEYYLNHNWAILINCKQKFLLNKEYGTMIFFGGVGLKYMF